MAGPITATYRLATKTFGAYHEEIKRILLKPRNSAKEADDAGLIGTYDYNALLKPARDDLAAHIARKDNPHLDTMDTHDSYGSNTLYNKLNQKVPNGVLPISHYGFLDELSDAQVDAAWTASGWVLTCSLTFNCALSGTVYRLPPQQLSLLSSDPAPANKTFNIYVRAQFGYITYQVRADSPPESGSVMFIGRCSTNANGIVSKQFAGVVRLDTFRLSTLPIGSAIPRTGGTYDAPVKLSAAAWNPR